MYVKYTSPMEPMGMVIKISVLAVRQFPQEITTRRPGESALRSSAASLTGSRVSGSLSWAGDQRAPGLCMLFFMFFFQGFLGPSTKESL